MIELPQLPLLPKRLLAPEPSWTETTDVCVVGSGIAGLTTALHLREAGLHVTVVTKVDIDDGSTRWAQGGIAAVLDPLDTPDAHAHDTMVAGVGLCDAAAVDVMVKEGPQQVRELIHTGAQFDRSRDGNLKLTREGGHRANRIIHAGGDATGAEVQRALHEAVFKDPWIRVIDHALVLDLLQDNKGRACGVSLHVLGEGTADGVGGVLARAVVLATGGMGQVFSSTTNPTVSTGDGVAAALRAGATVTDVEFVQFHPTALYLGGVGERDRQPLISEAMRGEGAFLRDGDGKRFMPAVHELAELAPRDVVAKAATTVMRRDGTNNVWLDARHMGETQLAERFPTIVASCREAGIDPAAEPIPVAPAAHYASGGVQTDLNGHTSVSGLYACGEAACTGVHGANRLASNSLLEGLVFARRIATDIAKELPEQSDPAAPQDLPAWVVSTSVRDGLQQAMTAGAGVLRSERSLHETASALSRVGAEHSGRPRTETWEVSNLLTVASALTAAAYARPETRGCHWRQDCPDADDAWSGHFRAAIDRDGVLTETWENI